MHIVQPREDEAFPTYTIAALPSPEETHLKSARPTLCFPPERVLLKACACRLLIYGHRLSLCSDLLGIESCDREKLIQLG